ncbi:BTAD domain-containing putative transcriptional regulator [Euzebya tangerina]|uniref:BTAD domain-containing putative transcriptional regulator n=1 Tax=Euzebya tangerina TaxID=591198 RepID=UPI0013C3161C|nr:BTAD domain-containing putative transcriptional regulator [Euzebya tangerina]
MTARTQFRVLGPVEYGNGLCGSSLGGRLHRSVLAVLIARVGQPASPDALVEAVWGHAPPTRPRACIQTYVSSLRGIIAEPIEYTGAAYRLDTPPESVDMVRFERAVEAARLAMHHDPGGACDLLDAALGLWRGPAFEDVADSTVLTQVARRLDELRLTALEMRMRAGLESQRLEGVASAVEPWLETCALRETFVGLAAMVLAAEGRQAEALLVIGRTRNRLREELGVNPGPSLDEVQRRLLDQDPTLVGQQATQSTPRDHNLHGDDTSFIGRTADVNQVVGLLSTNRLTTLVGPGGTGKTRLATEVGLEVHRTFAQGAWFVDLIPATSETGIWRELAATLPLVEPGTNRSLQEAVLDHLQRSSLVLILDNCEHVLEDAASVARDVMARAAHVRTLATSREPLRLRAEHLFRVEPLPTADPSSSAPSLAAQLFIDRAARTGQEPLMKADLSAIEAVCRRLDGLPLAVELAAAMTSTVTAGQILNLLADSPNAIVNRSHDRPDRHSSLRDTVAWSYGLLSASERDTLVRFAVFEGGFAIDDAHAVCADAGDGVEAITHSIMRLHEASLLVMVRGGDANRYTLLETVRAFARDLFADSPVRDELEQRHAEHFLAVAEAGFEGVWGTDEVEWLQRLYVSRPNLRRALDWWLRRDPGRAQMLAGSLTWFWLRRHLQSEAFETLHVALEASPVASPGRVRALFGLSEIVKDEDLDHATDLLVEAFDGAERFELWPDLWEIKYNLGQMAIYRGDHAAAVRHQESLFELAVRSEEPSPIQLSALALTGLWTMLCDFSAAHEWLSVADAAAAQWDSTRGFLYCDEFRGRLALAEGRFDDARSAFTSALETEEQLWSRPELPILALHLAEVAFATGDLTTAVDQTARTLARFERSHMTPEVADVTFCLRMAACLHWAVGNRRRAIDLKATAATRPDGWFRMKPMATWIAAIDGEPQAPVSAIPRTVDDLRDRMALHDLSRPSMPTGSLGIH